MIYERINRSGWILWPIGGAELDRQTVHHYWVALSFGITLGVDLGGED